jgi:hypothetical protein
MVTDIFAQMSDVELLGELRRIVNQAGQRQDGATATRAGELFSTFYAHRLRMNVPGWLWDDTRAFVRLHAS